MIITLIITASFENLSFNANYIGFTIILFIAYMIDHVLQRRLKMDIEELYRCVFNNVSKINMTKRLKLLCLHIKVIH